jgi:glucosylceramidase
VTRNVAFYTIAQAAKFVPPGSIRVESNTVEGLPNVAFKTPAGKVILIVTNPGKSDTDFLITYQGKSIGTSLKGGAVGTYAW